MQPPPGTPPLQWAIACNQRTKSLSLPTDIRSNMLVSQWVLSGLIHPHQAIGGFLSEAVMQESSVYQHLVETASEERYQQGMERGVEQGIAQGKREAVLRLLRRQFPDVPESIVQRITAINSISALDVLFDQAMTAESLDDLQI